MSTKTTQNTTKTTYTTTRPPLTVNDGVFPSDRELRIKAMVASGDYFDTLAHIIDGIHDSLEHPELESVIEDLRYLQRNYTISNK